MKKAQKSTICPKCQGNGKLDWTEQDGGVCYKCEGNGYLGEKPEGFTLGHKEAKKLCMNMLYTGLKKMQFKGVKELQYSYCEGNEYDAKYMKDNNIVFKYCYSELTTKFKGLNFNSSSELFNFNFTDKCIIITAI